MLIATYGDVGICIGSYLSQHLANYYLSYAYHYIEDNCFYTRRGKRINSIDHKLFYMDDIILFSSNKLPHFSKFRIHTGTAKVKLLHRCSQYGIVAVQIHDKRKSFIFQVIVRPVFRKCCSSLSCTAAFYCNSASNMLLYSLKVCVPCGS